MINWILLKGWRCGRGGDRDEWVRAGGGGGGGGGGDRGRGRGSYYGRKETV
jgi:hypothetical protein